MSFLVMMLAIGWGQATFGQTEQVTLPDAPPGPYPWTHMRFPTDSLSFRFVVMCDRTGANRPGVFEEAVKKVNLLQPDFVMCVGDLIEGNAPDAAELDRQWDELDALVDSLEAPFFYLAGNHDILNSPDGESVWRRRLGAPYYHFVYNNVLFLCLWSDDGGDRRLSHTQVDFVAKTLGEYPGVRWTFVFMHKPLWTGGAETNWPRVEELLGDRPYTVFAGHTHDYLKFSRRGRDYIILATTGAGTNHQGPIAGKFDQLVWVTMTDNGPQFANLLLDGILDKEVRTEQTAPLVDPVLRGEAVVAIPALLGAKEFAGGHIKLVLRNPSDLPVQMFGTIAPSPWLSPTPTRIERSLAGRATETATLQISASKPLDLRELPPIMSCWTLTYELPNRPPLAIPVTCRIVPADAPFICPRRPGPVTVDGSLADWPDLPFACVEPNQVLPNEVEWKGSGDCSFRFAAGHDDSFVYVGINVIDDRLQFRSEQSARAQDALLVRLDARPEADRSNERAERERERKDYLVIRIQPADGRQQASVEDMVEGTQTACVKTDSGYACEIAVPIAYLDSKQGGKWSAFRLNIAATDFDSVRDAGTQVWWRPHWATAANYAGSGTFSRDEGAGR